MRIVVNHLTRMAKGSRICVAGVDAETHAHVRPVTSSGDPITRDLLCENGGAFGIGSLVDLGPVEAQPSPPETEDHRFRTTNARWLETVASDKYWEMLTAIRASSLEEAFGPDLEPHGGGYAVDMGRGTRSLSVVRVLGRHRLIVNRWGKLRLSLDYPDENPSLSVGDVRVWEPDHTTVRRAVVADLNARLDRGIEAYMMLGLARAFQATNDDRDRHWLQVNGLCLADRPVGDVP